MDVGAECGDLLVVGDVEGAVGGHLCTEGTRIGDRLRQTFGVAVGEEQLGALGGELQCRCAPDPAGRPGQEAPLSRKASR